jgi:hypothetical protein
VRRSVSILFALALVAMGCEASRCETASVTLCKACSARAVAAAEKSAKVAPAADADGQPPTPGAFDLDSCVERTRQACEAHRSPPNCPF